ncbi:MAG: hypothetical protein MRJ96_02070 [Nitrospirales bacterium]|nr:hypothetical protein [Nitrospira sp.]MDR4500230.1 hypothetical protein [Nitrospirales bacterium]
MKKRFRGKGRTSDEAKRDHAHRNWQATHVRAKRDIRQRDIFHAQWQQLYDQCSDPGSHVRLVGLREQYERRQLGVSEPAQVETEVASFMLLAGFTVAFLEETAIRTADLECYLGEHRLFVEATAILRNQVRPEGDMALGHNGPQRLKEGDAHQDALARRLMARMAEKARQLNRYCAPILLAITIPTIERQEEEAREPDQVDLHRLAGLLSTALHEFPQLTAVLLTCWNLTPMPARSNIRLHNAYWVTRSKGGSAFPRIRLLVMNPSAAYGLEEQEVHALRAAL